MTSEMAEALDQCLNRLARGETIEQCLADYPQFRTQLKPLLEAASVIASYPGVVPPENIRQATRERLMSRIRRDAVEEGNKPSQKSTQDGLAGWLRRLRSGWMAQPSMIMVTAAVIMAVIALAVYISLFSPSSQEVLSAGCTLTQLKGNTLVQASGSDEWQPVNESVQLFFGDAVKTGRDSYAVLTFKDGSTAKLEPETSLVVAAVENRNIPEKVVLKQNYGLIWAFLPAGDQNDLEYEVQTPAAHIEAAGASFSSNVDSGGVTRVAAREGSVRVSALDASLALTMDQLTEIKPGLPPESPQLLSAALSNLLCFTGPEAASSIIDPSGSSTGYLPDGKAFNQILNSSISLSSVGQDIAISDPAPGEYTLAVRSLQSTVSVSLRMQTADGRVSEFKPVLENNQGNGWLVRFNLSAASDSARIVNLESVVPLGTEKPEKVTEYTVPGTTAASIVKPVSTPAPGPSTAAPTPSHSNSGPHTPTIPAVGSAAPPVNPSPVPSPLNPDYPVETPRTPAATPSVQPPVVTPAAAPPAPTPDQSVNTPSVPIPVTPAATPAPIPGSPAATHAAQVSGQPPADSSPGAHSVDQTQPVVHASDPSGGVSSGSGSRNQPDSGK
jgi:hypothetical protein